MKRKTSVLMMILMIIVSSFCITVFNVNKDVEAIADSYSDDNTYVALSNSTVEEETITCSSRNTAASKFLNGTCPEYYNTNNALSNTCANVAGTNVLGFYDRYYDNLIPDYTAGIMRDIHYVYYPMAYNQAKKQDVINDLYNRMKTNTKNPGTTQDDFESGLKSYVQSKGNSLTYTSVMSNGSFSMDKFVSELNKGKPVVLFLLGYNLTNFTDTDTYTIITKCMYSGNHIVVAYGYFTVNYYDSNSKLITTKTYLKIASGFNLEKGYFLLNGGGTINAAQAVEIS